MVDAFRHHLLVAVLALAGSACAPVATLWPGRIMAMTPEELLRRLVAVAEDGRLLDQPFVERALGVRFGPLLPLSPPGSVERYLLTWIDAPEPLQRPFADRARPRSGQPPFERIILPLPRGGPCITFQAARRILGEGFEVPLVVPSVGPGPTSPGHERTPLSADWRVRDAPAGYLSLAWQGNPCVVVITLTVQIN